MTLYLPGRRPVDFSEATEIGSGAGGVVYTYPHRDQFCMKLYYDPTPALDRRYQGLRRMPPVDWEAQAGAFLSWPRFDLRDDDLRLRGFVMDRAAGQPLYGLLDPRIRDDVLDAPTWATLLVVAERVARMMARIHVGGLVIGDVSPANILVDHDATVTFIDCDSYQFLDPWTREPLPALNHTPEYSSPEAIAEPGAWLTRHHDEFGLCIIVCQLLTEGEHPYEGVPWYGADVGVAGNIASGTSRPFGPGPMRDAAGALGVDPLPDEVRELARRCLVDGHASPAARPSAADWSAALSRVAGELAGCDRNARHAFWRYRGPCFWCERAGNGHGEHYPEGRVRQRDHRRPSTTRS